MNTQARQGIGVATFGVALIVLGFLISFIASEADLSTGSLAATEIGNLLALVGIVGTVVGLAIAGVNLIRARS